MGNVNIDAMIERKQLKLSFWQNLTHFSAVGFLLLISFFDFYNVIIIYFSKTYSRHHITDILIYNALPFFILAIIFVFIQKKRLKFKEIQIFNSSDDFQEAIKRTAEDYKWRIEHQSENYLRAYHYSFWDKSMGEMITIIRKDDKIFINSICDLDFSWHSLPIISFGWNKKNVQFFLINLHNVIDKIPYVAKNDENELLKWNFTDILQRIFIYGLCLFLLIISFCGLNENGVIVTRLMALIIGVPYFYFIDYQLIKLNKKL